MSSGGTEHKHQFSLVREELGGPAFMLCECEAKVKTVGFTAKRLFDIETEYLDYDDN